MSDETRGKTGPRIFVSYRHTPEDETWMQRVVTHLRALEHAGRLTVWHDQQNAPGALWRDDLKRALDACDVALLLVSADSLTSDFILDEEVRPLLTRRDAGRARVIPVLVRPCLWKQIPWLEPMQLWPRDGRPLSALSPNDAEQALADLCAEVLKTPAVARSPAPAGVVPVAFRNWPQGSSDGVFLGRGPELALLDEAWADTGRTTVVTLVAAGGVGKTTLVRQWLDRLRADGWRSASRVYAWSFYSQGTDESRQASDDTFLDEALKWFGIRHDAKSAADKGRVLGEALSHERALLVLDGVEPLQYPPGPLGGRLRANGVEALLTHVATAGAPGLIVVTTREALVDLRDCERNADRPAGAVVAHDVDNLDEADGARVLHRLGVRRAGAATIADDDEELRAASREVNGHALTLSLLGTFLAQAHDGDVRRRDRVDFTEADAEVRGGHAFRVIEAYEVWLGSGDERSQRALAVARLLGLFDRPADAECLAALRKAPPIAGLTEALFEQRARGWRAWFRKPVPLGENDWRLAVGRARKCGLLLPGDGEAPLDAHPIVRDCFARRLREEYPEAWREGHRRLYEHLAYSTIQFQPDGLAGLQPLYQAIAHGCRAGRYRRAFADYLYRTLRGTGDDGFYSVAKLGALGTDLMAVAGFFEERWSRVTPRLARRHQAWLVNEAAFCLSALGRLAEAREPMRAGLNARLDQRDWKNASISASNLSRIELTLGNIAASIHDGEQSVALADRCGEMAWEIVTRAVLANSLHQAGRRAEAAELFDAADKLQAQGHANTLLCSLPGIFYCDLLLAETERSAAHPRIFTAATMRPGDASEEFYATTLLEASRSSGQLLDIGLSHLTLARVALYRALLEPARAAVDLAMAREHATQAVDGLRASDQSYLPRGLLTRAWLRAVEGDAEHAKADLDEAQRIAERGSMRLHLADVHLHRARLFRDRRALTEARRLIEECGYHRRDEELHDTEEAARSWGDA